MKKITYLIILAVALSSCAGGGIFASKKSNNIVDQPAILNAESQLMESYRMNVAQSDALAVHISNLTAQMNSARGAKAKKIGKELVKVQGEFDAVQRLLATYPKSLTSPAEKINDQAKEAEIFRQELDRKLEQKLANTDMNKEVLADIKDPELRRAYENYQKYGEKGGQDNDKNANLQMFFTVQIGSGQVGQARYYRDVKNVQEMSVTNSRSVYITGRFATENEAKKHRDMIRLNPKYKSAYIVAFYNDRPISMEQARTMGR